MVADEAFPLQTHWMRPFPGKTATTEEQVYNYRHCRARRIVENAFGILSQKWRVFNTKIAVQPDTMVLFVQASVVLHNMLQKQNNTALSNEELADEVAHFQPLRRVGCKSTKDAQQVRETFSKYFNEHPLPWHDAYIQRGLNN